MSWYSWLVVYMEKYIMQGEEQASITEICKSASLQICEISMNGIDQGQLTESLNSS